MKQLSIISFIMSVLLVQAISAPSFEGDTYYGKTSDTDHNKNGDSHYQSFEKDWYGDYNDSA